MTDGLSELARRVDELDAAPECTSLLFKFVCVMQSITSAAHVRGAPGVSFAEADELMRRSRLLRRLTNDVPEIVAGPLRLDSQYWIGTEKPYRQDAVELTPQESAFVRLSEATTKGPSTKPFGVGLFTSTGNCLSAHGMWRLYLEGSTVARHVWTIDINACPVVREVTAASDWVDFVLSHPRREGDLLFPDWIAVARHYDAVHMTLRAIAAVQGLCFPTEHGTVAPTYWDVESTLWLRWCFGSARLVEIVEAERVVDAAPAERAPRLVPKYLPYPTSAWIEAIVAPSDDNPK